MIKFDKAGSTYKENKKYKHADGDAVATPTPAPTTTGLSANTKKYLLWGGIAIVAYFLWKKFGK
jgi:hypothetical protein